MNELQLVGYTADLNHLVLSDTRGASRFKVPVDSDLLATVEEVVGLTDPSSEIFSALRAAEPAPPPPPPPPVETVRSGPAPGEGALVAAAVLLRRASNGHVEDDETSPRPSRLSPREIQSLLRAGKSTKAVAQQADTSEEWVARWLPPIEGEREQVLIAVRNSRMSKARLGESRDVLGDAVRRNLAQKGVDSGSDATWSARRRDGQDAWTVELRYRSRNRAQKAVWSFDPDTGELEARNRLATEIAWTRPRGRGGKDDAGATASVKQRSASKSSRTSSSARTPAGTSPVEGSDMASNSAKRSAKKSAGKKASAKKSAKKSTKRTAKKGAAKRTAKRTAKKSPAKRTAKKTAKKAARKTAKKSPAKRTGKKAAKKTARKTAAKKTARKR